MEHIDAILALRDRVSHARRQGKRIGLVPTMGFLHEGHLSLVEAAHQHSDFVVVSVFVNPTQFGPTEDLEKYPRDLQRDKHLLDGQGYCHVLFTPSVQEMYPSPQETTVNLPTLTQSLCGKSRPGHFAGVATVVCKLFNIVCPDVALFGQKDGQQLAVIQRMVRDLNFPIDVIGVPTVREADGLAKSSRNAYLSATERGHAPILFQALSWARAEIESGQRLTSEILSGIRNIIDQDGLAQIEYVEAVRCDTLQPTDTLEGDIMIAVAAKIGTTRLIDNIRVQIGYNATL